MEGLVPGAADEAQVRKRWEEYMANLKNSDPAEYEALVKDLDEMIKTGTSFSEKPTDALRAAAQEDRGEFAPVLPGGAGVMGTGGVEAKKEGVPCQPSPGFVIKTREMSGSARKVFINVCQSPMLKNFSMQKRIGNDGKEQEGMSIPLSCGRPRPDTDKSGKSCVVYDVIVNPGVVEEAKTDAEGQFRGFLCNLCVQYIEQKYKCSLDGKCKFPRMKYKGDASNTEIQFIRKKQTPTIEEVKDDRPQKSKKTMQNKIKASQQRKRPRAHATHSLSARTTDGMFEKCEAMLSDPRFPEDPAVTPEELLLVVKFNHDGKKLSAAEIDSLRNNIDLALSSEIVSVKVAGGSVRFHPLEIFLPHAVNVADCRARFEQSTQELRVNLPCANGAFETDGPDPGSKPWMLAHAIASDDSIEAGPSPATKTKPEEDNDNGDDDGVLPEDRFHRRDMVSQHIKDEREQQREDKLKRHNEKKEKERLEEEKKAAEEAAQKAQALIDQVDAEMQSCALDLPASSPSSSTRLLSTEDAFSELM